MIIQRDSYKEKTSTPRKRGQPSTTIKAPIPSQIKVRIIYHSLILESCENNSNLTFGEYSASNIPVLSVRSSLFSMQVSLQACKDRVLEVTLPLIKLKDSLLDYNILS